MNLLTDKLANLIVSGLLTDWEVARWLSMGLSRWVDEYVSEWQGAGVLALLIYWLTDELNDQMKSWLNY